MNYLFYFILIQLNYIKKKQDNNTEEKQSNLKAII